MYWMVILISSLLSGLLGVGISTWYHQRNEIRRTKLQVLQQLLGNRHDIMGQLFTEALNQVFVIFYDECSEDHRSCKPKASGFVQSNV